METAEAVQTVSPPDDTPLKRGVNESRAVAWEWTIGAPSSLFRK